MIIDMKKLMEQLNDIDVSEDIHSNDKFQSLYNDLEELRYASIPGDDIVEKLGAILEKYSRYTGPEQRPLTTLNK